MQHEGQDPFQSEDRKANLNYPGNKYIKECHFDPQVGVCKLSIYKCIFTVGAVCSAQALK